jgi:SpoVK/Ycf46/Vps4 family AAA+-type ATPase
MKQKYQTPILSDDLNDKISDAITAFTNRGTWQKWGLDKLREQGVAILLHGDPGTGKTITAYWIAKRLHLGLREVSMADFGSQIPGQNARNIQKIFYTEQLAADNDRRHPPVILLDECDSMLISRARLGPNMVWMLEPINMLLAQIGKYPGLVVLATNSVDMLDPALERRLLAKVEFGRPEPIERLQMWKSKWPSKFPVQPTEREFDELARFDLTGAQIESAFLLWTATQIRKNIEPRVPSLLEFLANQFDSYYATAA